MIVFSSNFRGIFGIVNLLRETKYIAEFSCGKRLEGHERVADGCGYAAGFTLLTSSGTTPLDGG